MPNWNLSVDLRARGGDLARGLRESANAARLLARDSQSARRGLGELGTTGRRIRTLGDDARFAARHVRTLGQDARTAARLTQQAGQRAQASGRMLRTLGSDSQRTGARIRTLGTDADRAATHLRQLATSSRDTVRQQQAAGRAARQTAEDFQRLARQMQAAVRDMRRLATASTTATRGLRATGDGATRSMGRMAGAVARVRSEVSSLAGFLAGGALILGGAEIIKEGNAYQRQMNTLRAVTGANAVQMQHAAVVAKQLGADLSLPASTATDAAEAMVDLAKAGFRADQAISASRAALELSTGLHVDAAKAAMYLGDVMDQFALDAGHAGQAADTLAATATGASGGIRDIWYAMKYAGPVAHSLSISMQDTAAAIVGLGKAGIIGQTAGTTLRGALSNLAAPTDQMKDGLKTLGIEAFDSSGKFKGLATVIGGLHKAQERLSQQDFVGAVKKAFGKPAMSGMIALGHQGVEAFEAARQTVSQYGKAADVAGAQSKGLTGAMTQLKTQARQSGLAIYEGLAPGLEFLARGMTRALASATPHITDFIHYGNDLATLFGPSLAARARAGLSTLADEAENLAGPLRDLGEHAAADALHILINTARTAADVLGNLIQGLQPVGDGMKSLTDGSSGASNALDILVEATDLALSAVSALSKILGPVGQIVGGLAHAFGSLPGPVQTAVAAMLLTRRVGPIMSGLAGTVSGRVTGSFRSLSQQMAVQRSLATAAGASLSRYGAALAVLQARVPFIGAMASSFRTASAAGTGFTGTLRGITAAAGTGMRRSLSGLVGVLGGPWGVAMLGATVGLGLLASSQQKAAAAAAEHRADISSLADALRESNGVIDESVRQTAAQTIAQKKLGHGVKADLVDVMKQAGYSLSDVTDAYLGQGTSIDKLVAKLRDLAKAGDLANNPDASAATVRQSLRYSAAADALEGMSGNAKKAARDAKDLADATKGADATAFDRLKDSMGELADKTSDADQRAQALKQSLDLLSGGSISLQAAQARVNSAILALNDNLDEGIKKSDGWGRALLNSNGALNTATKNGQQLYQSLTDVTDASSSAAVAAFKLADENGKGLPAALKAAQSEMQKSRDAAVEAAQGYGLTKKQAEGVADSLGLIPKKVALLLQADGVDETLADLLAVQAEFTRLPKAKTIKVDTLSDEAQKKLTDLGYKVETVPGTREIKVTAPTAAARKDLDNLIDRLSKVPGAKSVAVRAQTGEAISDLEAVQKKIRGTNGKTITMRAPTAAARTELERLGFQIKNTKGKNVVITVPTGGPRSAVAAIQSAINSLHGKTVTNTIKTLYFSSKQPGPYAGGYRPDKNANGGVVHAAEGFTVPGYAPRVDSVPALLSPGEGVLVPEAVRKLGILTGMGGPGFIKSLNAWARYGTAMRFADGGVAGPQRFADGGFTYQPGSTRRAVSDVQSRYADAHQPISRDDYLKAMRARANAADTLRSAETRLNQVRRHRHTHAQLVAAETAVGKARRSLATATDKARTAQARYNKAFSLTDWSKTLKSSVAANAAWEANLSKIGKKAGYDVEQTLRDMGDDGAAMVSALAKASSKQFADIVANLKKLTPSAKAALADYTAQLNATNKTSATFQANLAKLASMGYGDLAAQLASQGDEAAQKVAAGAAASSSAAAAANQSAKANAGLLTGDQLAELVQIIAAVKTATTGIHDVAAATGLGEDEIIAVATKAKKQIASSLGGRAGRFLADLAKAGAGMAYANGGIRPGLYPARAPYGMVRWAEPETGGEAYIPLGANKRGSATAVLTQVAGRFGLGVTHADDRRPQVVVVQPAGPAIGSLTIPVTQPRATATQIADAVGYQARRARRGGVGR